MPEPTSNQSSRKNLESRDDIELLVNTFYEKVRSDALLGFIFDDVAAVNWETHLPKMYSFWETVVLGSGTYRGNPLGAHAKLVPHTAMGKGSV